MTAPATPRRQWPALPNGGRFLDAAVRYAIEGWPIFPLKPRKKTPMSLNGVKDATTDRKPSSTGGESSGRRTSAWRPGTG